MSDVDGLRDALVDEGPEGDEAAELVYSPGIEVPEEMRAEIVTYVKDEVEAMAQAREEREEYWNVWRRHREARPEQKVRTFPWDGASNVVPPVAASNTSGVFSHIRRAFLKRKPLFTPQPHTKGAARQAEAFGKLLNTYFVARSKSNSLPVLKKALYEAISLGNQIIEVPWLEKRVRYTRQDIDGGIVKVDKVVYSGPVMELHRLENVYVRPEIESIEDQPVVAVRYQGYTPGKLLELERDGFFTNVQPVVDAGQASEEDDNLEKALSREGLEVPDTTDTPMIDLMKAWVYWDVDGDGVPEDVIVWYHDETETILRVELNDFGVRLLTNLQYLPQAFQFYAKGVGEMAEHVQEEITSLHNMRLDSLSLSSLQMLAMKPGTEPGKGAKFYPGKIIRTENPREDMQSFTFPDVSAATLNAEIQAKRYLDTHTGVSEAMLGMPDQTAKSGTSPSLQMFLAEQGNSILETAIESLSEGLSEVGMFFTLQMVKNSASVLEYLEELVDEDDVDIVREFLSMDIEDVPLRVGMSIKTTEVQKSEDAKRQNLMALNQLYSMFGQEVMQYMQVMASPEAPPELKQFAVRFYLGKSKIMEQTLELFGTSDTEDYVAYTRDLEVMLEALDAQKRQMVAQMGGNGGTQEAGMAGVGGGAGAVAPGQGAGMAGSIGGAGPEPGDGGGLGPGPGGGQMVGGANDGAVPTGPPGGV